MIYTVCYKVSESVFSSNIAIAKSADDVRAYYEAEGKEVLISEANTSAIKEAYRKGKPIVRVDAKIVLTIEEVHDSIDYVLIRRASKCEPWVACWGFDWSDCSWAQGHYFKTYREAKNYIDRKEREERYNNDYYQLAEQ